jgi:hypothetical protein
LTSIDKEVWEVALNIDDYLECGFGLYKTSPKSVVLDTVELPSHR